MPEGKVEIIYEPLEQEIAFYYGSLTEEQLGLISRALNYQTGEEPLMVYVGKYLIKVLSDKMLEQYDRELAESAKETKRAIELV